MQALAGVYSAVEDFLPVGPPSFKGLMSLTILNSEDINGESTWVQPPRDHGHISLKVPKVEFGLDVHVDSILFLTQTSKPIIE